MGYPVPRDGNGWRIPRQGTRSHAVYMGMVAGKTPKQIVGEIGGSLDAIYVLAWRIRNPDAANKAQAEQANTRWHFKGGREARRERRREERAAQ